MGPLQPSRHRGGLVRTRAGRGGGDPDPVGVPVGRASRAQVPGRLGRDPARERRALGGGVAALRLFCPVLVVGVLFAPSWCARAGVARSCPCLW